MVKNIINKFRENRELFFGYSSFIGLIITGVYTISSLYYSQWNISFNATVIILAVVNGCLAGISIYAIRRYDKLHQTYSDSANKINNLNLRIENKNKIIIKTAQILHNFNHEYRKLVNEIYTNLKLQHFDLYENVRSSFKMFLIFILSNIKEIFDILTGDECSVCIKLVTKSGEDFIIRTYMRDNISYRIRSETDKSLPNYHHYQNTAFKNILDTHCSDVYYLCNNLKNEKGYLNSNPNWQHFYNACLVVPIRLVKKTKKDEDSVVIGFICVDNFKGNFDNPISVDILASFADSCFYLFRLFNEFSNIKNLQKTV